MINEIMNIRKELGWTQARLAEHLGVNTRTVGRWELGQTLPSQLATEKIVRLQRDIMIGKITLNNTQKLCSQNLGGIKGKLIGSIKQWFLGR